MNIRKNVFIIDRSNNELNKMLNSLGYNTINYYNLKNIINEIKKYNPDFHVCYNKGHVGYLDKPVIKDYSYFSFESLPGVE